MRLIEFKSLDGETIVINSEEVVCFGERGQGIELATGDGYLTVVIEGTLEQVKKQLSLKTVDLDSLNTATGESIGVAHIVPDKVIAIRESAEGIVEVRLGTGGFYVQLSGSVSDVVDAFSASVSK